MSTTKNADLPAMPIDIDGRGQFAPETHLGLTKREYFAGLAMQSLGASADEYSRFYEMAADAVAMADALLAELESQKRQGGDV